jgi:hypothetical protein
MIRIALLLLLTALPATAETTDITVACLFDHVCTADGCNPIAPVQVRLATEASGDAVLTWLSGNVDQALAHEVTPRGTVMAHGMDGADMVFLALAPTGELALTRVMASGEQEKLVGRCE